MAAWVCTGCTAAYSVGAPCCPHCGSTDYREQGEEHMPKITRHGGPTIAGAAVVAGGWSSEGEPDVWPDLNTEGGEESSPGNSSSTSGEKPSSMPEPSENSSPSRARTTASRSKKAPTGSRSARSTGGGQAGGTSAAEAEGSE